MTKVNPETEHEVHNEALQSVSADVSFSSNHFPKYKIGPDNQIVEEPRLDPNALSLKEVVAKETSQLTEQHKRLSVRDLASKFDKNLSAAAKLSEEVLGFSNPLFVSKFYSGRWLLYIYNCIFVFLIFSLKVYDIGFLCLCLSLDDFRQKSGMLLLLRDMFY